jgi:hypothetical protein
LSVVWNEGPFKLDDAMSILELKDRTKAGYFRQVWVTVSGSTKVAEFAVTLEAATIGFGVVQGAALVVDTRGATTALTLHPQCIPTLRRTYTVIYPRLVDQFDHTFVIVSSIAVRAILSLMLSFRKRTATQVHVMSTVEEVEAWFAAAPTPTTVLCRSHRNEVAQSFNGQRTPTH